MPRKSLLSETPPGTPTKPPSKTPTKTATKSPTKTATKKKRGRPRKTPPPESETPPTKKKRGRPPKPRPTTSTPAKKRKRKRKKRASPAVPVKLYRNSTGRFCSKKEAVTVQLAPAPVEAKEESEESEESGESEESEEENGSDESENSDEASSLDSEEDNDEDSSQSSSSSDDTTDFLNQHNDLCQVCDLGGEVLCCATCNLVFHLDCVRPSIKKEPPDDWSCAFCISSGIRGYKRDSHYRRRCAASVRLMESVKYKEKCYEARAQVMKEKLLKEKQEEEEEEREKLQKEQENKGQEMASNDEPKMKGDTNKEKHKQESKKKRMKENEDKYQVDEQQRKNDALKDKAKQKIKTTKPKKNDPATPKVVPRKVDHFTKDAPASPNRGEDKDTVSPEVIITLADIASTSPHNTKKKIESRKLIDCLTQDMDWTKRTRRSRRQPIIYDPQICAASDWQSDRAFEFTEPQSSISSQTGTKSSDNDRRSDTENKLETKLDKALLQHSSNEGKPETPKKVKQTIHCARCGKFREKTTDMLKEEEKLLCLLCREKLRSGGSPTNTSTSTSGEHAVSQPPTACDSSAGAAVDQSDNFNESSSSVEAVSPKEAKSEEHQVTEKDLLRNAQRSPSTSIFLPKLGERTSTRRVSLLSSSSKYIRNTSAESTTVPAAPIEVSPTPTPKILARGKSDQFCTVKITLKSFSTDLPTPTGILSSLLIPQASLPKEDNRLTLKEEPKVADEESHDTEEEHQNTDGGPKETEEDPKMTKEETNETEERPKETEKEPKEPEEKVEETEKEPEETEKKPEETEKEPEETEREPEETEKEFEETEKEPEETEKEPEETEGEAKETDEEARKTEEKPKETEEKPKETEEKLKETEEKPKETEEEPRKTEEEPRKTEEKPRETEEKSKETEEKPKETEKEPRVTEEDTKVSEDDTRIAAGDTKIIEEESRVNKEPNQSREKIDVEQNEDDISRSQEDQNKKDKVPEMKEKIAPMVAMETEAVHPTEQLEAKGAKDCEKIAAEQASTLAKKTEKAVADEAAKKHGKYEAVAEEKEKKNIPPSTPKKVSCSAPSERKSKETPPSTPTKNSTRKEVTISTPKEKISSKQTKENKTRQQKSTPVQIRRSSRPVKRSSFLDEYEAGDQHLRSPRYAAEQERKKAAAAEQKKKAAAAKAAAEAEAKAKADAKAEAKAKAEEARRLAAHRAAEAQRIKLEEEAKQEAKRVEEEKQRLETEKLAKQKLAEEQADAKKAQASDSKIESSKAMLIVSSSKPAANTASVSSSVPITPVAKPDSTVVSTLVPTPIAVPAPPHISVTETTSVGNNEAKPQATTASNLIQQADNTGEGAIPVKVPRRKPGARECMQISRRFGVQVIPQKYMDTLLDYCTRGKVEHLIRMRERLDEHSHVLEAQLAGLEELVREKGELKMKSSEGSTGYEVAELNTSIH